MHFDNDTQSYMLMHDLVIIAKDDFGGKIEIGPLRLNFTKKKI